MERTRIIHRRFVRADGSVREYDERRKIVNTSHRMKLSPEELDGAVDAMLDGKALREVAAGLHIPVPTLTRLVFARSLERLKEARA